MSTSAFASSRATDPPNLHYDCQDERSGPFVGCLMCGEDRVLEWVTIGRAVLCAGCPVCDTAVFIEYV